MVVSSSGLNCLPRPLTHPLPAVLSLTSDFRLHLAPQFLMWEVEVLMASASQAVGGFSEARAAWNSARHAPRQALTVAGARLGPLVGLSQRLQCLRFHRESGLCT